MSCINLQVYVKSFMENTFNIAISEFMVLHNILHDAKQTTMHTGTLHTLLQLLALMLAPVAPHLAFKLWDN